ncbi:hypothetical protein BKA70DRAFT_850997 [Coprinopsis sp. MPI-PUGE-AT-0042]|nr:hypothetical protein BKA70DRAFT_850997 [Coprinopsis sp. MPI-PUGE-AT-0042]
MPLMRPSLLLSLLSLPWVVSGLRNLTVDDDDPRIRYEPPGAWHLSDNSTLDVGYAHMLTENPNATAIFNFTGVAIYFMSPLWSYAVSTMVTLDDTPPAVIDLVDHSRPDVGGTGPETVQSQVVWSATGLNDTQHTLVISVANQHRFAIVDGLLYTVEGTDPGTNSASSPSSSIPGDQSSSDPPLETQPTDQTDGISTAPRGQVVGGIIAAVVVILIVLVLGAYFFFLRRRTRQRSKAEAPTPPRASFATSLVEKPEAGGVNLPTVSRNARLSTASISSPRSLQWGMYEIQADRPLRTSSGSPLRQ